MKSSNVLLASAVFMASTVANATIITQFGDNVSFTYDDATAYGSGTVVGNNIYFTPTTLLAESYDGLGNQNMSETLNINVVATTPGFNMNAFTLLENGDYKLSGAGADVDAQGFFQITSNTNIIGCGGLCQTTELYTAGALPDTGGALALWNMGGTVNLGSIAGWGSDTDVTLTIQNNLMASTTDTGELAFIQKKFSIEIPSIPVPAAVWLFGSGLLGLIAVARRRVIH